MKLIVGLGNPGLKYVKTRHNAGFIVLDHFFNSNNIVTREKNGALYAEERIEGEKVIFIKPLSFMNLSGEVIKTYIDFYKIDVSNLLVIYDDISYEIGRFKLKPKGSSGGHNGLKNIIKLLKTDEFKRLKIGISHNDIDLMSYVLGKFSKDQFKKLSDILDITDNIINDFIVYDFDYVMNKYN